MSLEAPPETISFFVQGEPVAQPRGRAVNIKGVGIRVIGATTKHPIHLWKQALMSVCETAMQGFRLYEDPIDVALVFLMARPKSMPKRTANQRVPHTKKPDIDNVAKGVLDAFNARLWGDDSQIYSLKISKRYVMGDEKPGVFVRVSVVVPDLPF